MVYPSESKSLAVPCWYVGTRGPRKYPTSTIDQQRIAGLRPEAGRMENWRFIHTNWVDRVAAVICFGLPIIIIIATHIWAAS